MTYCDKSVLAPECNNKDCKECYPMPTKCNWCKAMARIKCTCKPKQY